MRQILLALLLSVAATPVAAQSSAPIVSTDKGRVAGATTPDAKVHTFFGIPYAAPPIGDLRWRPPQPVARWRGVREATSFGARCMQQPLFSDMRFRSPAPSEDCLYLNVWTPAGPARRLPVLFYIYGGGFVAGDGSEKRYDGASMARRGIVVVTLNYRLGVFGFLAHPALTAESPHHASGDYGLLDQAAALDWVRRNIAAFGGDPNRITVGGESAGSISVGALMASPLTRTQVAGAIGESGAPMGPTIAPMPLTRAEASGRAFAESLGATTLAEMRALPADQLLAAQGRARDLRIAPVIDGWFLREAPEVTFAAGRQARVPLLAGTNSQEAPAEAVLGSDPPTLAGYRAALARLFGPDAAAVEALYPAASDADVPRAATELASDRFLAHATWKWFDLHRRSGAPTWYYRYTRIRPPALDAPTAPSPLGAVHSAEIEYALGNLGVNPSYAWTEDDRRVSAAMQAYFARFIKTGNPNGPGLPAWPRAPAGEGPILRQRLDVVPAPEPLPEARYRAIEPLLRPR